MITVTIKRPTGKIETVDVSPMFGSMTQHIFDKLKADTKAAGRGDVIEATTTHQVSNIADLMRAYNNGHNEGGEGYVPDTEYFIKSPKYKTWTETKTIR